MALLDSAAQQRLGQLFTKRRRPNSPPIILVGLQQFVVEKKLLGIKMMVTNTIYTKLTPELKRHMFL